MSVRRAISAAVAALFVLAVAVPCVLAYDGQVATSVSVSGPAGGARCNSVLPVSVTVLDAGGRAVTNEAVTWSFIAPAIAGDTIEDTTTTTDASGASTTDVHLSCTPGERTLEAHSGDAFGSLVLGIQAVGLPRTDTAPVSMPWATVASLVVAAAGLLLIGRRIAVRR